MMLKDFFQAYKDLPAPSGVAMVFDLNHGEQESYFWGEAQENTLFDLASISKPLNIAFAYLEYPFEMNSELGTLANHRAGFEAHRVLNAGWREELLSIPLQSSQIENYSDLSLLRFMLEWERQSGVSLENIAKSYENKDFVFWKRLSDKTRCLPMGLRDNKDILGTINDDNAYMIDAFVSHTGYFASPKGLLKTLILLKEKRYLEKMKTNWKTKAGRFFWGFDTPSGEQTLAGASHPQKTIGFLGFTGTSVWLDLDSLKGYMLLTNRVHFSPLNTEGINQLRRELGQEVWKSFT